MMVNCMRVCLNFSVHLQEINTRVCISMRHSECAGRISQRL